MSYFTRTGLIPSITTSVENGRHIQQKIPNIFLSDVVIVAPYSCQTLFQDRPYAYPYSSSCSILCNHPITDNTTKKLISETKEIIKNRRTITRPIKLKRNFIEYYCTHEDDYIGNHEEDIFVPEILFRHYTQTDSTPQTSTLSTPRLSYPRVIPRTSTSAVITRRCVTPDDHLLNAPERTSLVLDLRKCLSQNSLTFEETKHASGRPKEKDITIARNSIPTTVMSYGVLESCSKSASLSQRQKPSRLFHDNDNYKYSTTKTCSREMKNDTLFKKNAVALEGNLKKEPKKFKKIRKNRKHEKRTSKKTYKVDLNSEIKDFSETCDTEIANNPNISIDKEDGDEDEDNRGTIRNQFTRVGSIGCSSTYEEDTNFSNEYIGALLKKIDPEMLENDINADKYIRFLEQTNLIISDHCIVMNTLEKKHESNLETNIQSISSNEIGNSKDEVIPPSPTELSRIISRRNARFELPLDKTDLEGMTPLEYLKYHVYISDGCRVVYNRIFHTYSKTVDAEHAYLNTKRDLSDALVCALGKNFQHQEQINLTRLLVIGEDSCLRIDLRTWYGICALCERIYGSRLTSRYASRAEDPCHEIEKIDFEFLDKNLATLKMNDELKEILLLIRDS